MENKNDGTLEALRERESILWNGDCLELMKNIPDKSIDMILCDLPYGTTACKWDTIIPFEPLWKQYDRIIKINGAIILFGSEPFSSYLRMSNIRLYKYDWIWEKNTATGFQLSKCKPLNNIENIIVFSKGTTYPMSKNKMKYYPQGLIELNKYIRHGVNNIMTKTGSNKKSEKILQEYTNYPRRILKYDKDGKLHSSQKPVALLEYLIKTYTNEGDLVLDNCMGSGSTGVACKHLNRKFIGIELDREYFEIAKNRIENE